MKPTAVNLMIQGATSDAGKSAVVTGLCRILHRRGLKVAPFKPQNMALNSAVTVDGGEIGRAQALQAQACGLEPHTDMNPILLKPNTDIGAQVIIQGKARENMDAYAYHAYKKTAMKWVLESYHRLADIYDVILIEGAGSPAEINLREHDIANMGFAEAINCPVAIVADIDRGGVFAHLYGTLALLSASEQERVKGFIINKFRGDVELLLPGNDWLEEKTGKKVLGVLPYLHHLHLEAEDAISRSVVSQQQAESHQLKIIVPILSRISNHTDFDPLVQHPQVDLEFVRLDQPIPPADLIILPGSKSVRDDLTLLRQHHWHQHIQKHLRYGGKLMGICGGYQMLGHKINDPLGLEGTPGMLEGLGYLNCHTTLHAEKQLHQVKGYFCNPPQSNSRHISVEGYEIHVGTTRQIESMTKEQHLIQLSDGRQDGLVSLDQQILGTYLHGIFENRDACRYLLEWAGLNNAQEIDYRTHREQAIDIIADSIEDSLDLAWLSQQIGINLY